MGMKLCSYFRSIDLLLVYKQLDDFHAGYSETGLGNIPESMSHILSGHLEERAYSTFEHLYNENFDWRALRPIDIAAEVGDYLERDLEQLESACSIKAPSPNSKLPAPKWLDKFNLFVNAALNESTEDYFLLQALYLYQYDCICWLHETNNATGIVQTLEDLTDTTYALANFESRHIGAELAIRKRSDEARDRAAIRHKETNQQKVAAIAAWEEHGANVSSKAAFARARWKEFGVTERTLYGWIRAHSKTGF